MTLPGRRLLLGLSLGALGLAAPVPSWADGSDAAFNADRLVKFNDRPYAVHYEDWVSTVPISRVTVRKISYGKTRFVDIATTATGTYSSEALVSPFIRYPGIHVRALQRPRFNWALVYRGDWVAERMSNARSFVTLD